MKKAATTGPQLAAHGFNTATIVQVGLIPMLTVGFFSLGFYFTAGDTLRQHDKDIQAIQVDRAKVKATVDENREKDRNTFLIYQQKTNEILSKLDTRLAVSETKQETANQTLAKIADELSKIASMSGRK